MRRSIGKAQAVKMFEDEWWVGKRYKDIALVGLSLMELTVPLTILQLAVESTLCRMVLRKEIEEEADKLLLEVLGGMPPLTILQIAAIAFPKEKDRIK